MVKPPVSYTPSVETPAEDEAGTTAQLNVAFDVILERTAADYGHAVRAVHAKAHAVLHGTFTVHDGLPPELAQGLFARPGTYDARLRVSTNAGDILPDAVSLPRGLAIKVLGVEGERLPGAEGTSQDFVLVNGKVFQAKTAEQFLGSLKLLASTTDRIEGGKKAISAVLRGVRAGFEAVGAEPPAAVVALGGAHQAEPLGLAYYSTVPFRYGDYIAKFGVFPVAPAMTALTGKDIDVDGRDDAIREDLRNEMRGLDAVWAFRVQLCRDLERQPVEDPTVEWDEGEAPFVTVATLRAPAQDSWAPALVEEIDERMRFSVWTGLAAHQPLGNINRARRDAYRHSADFRARVNACPYHEPAGA